MQNLYSLIKEILMENEDYKGVHKAPGPDRGVPLHDLTANENSVYPDDVYDKKKGPQYYGIGDGSDMAAWNLIYSAKGNPGARIKIYRAVPATLKNVAINVGDWVTIDRSYAVSHGESRFDGEYKILSEFTVAKNLYTDGNSILEWGFYP